MIADRLAPMAFSANMHPIVERFHDLFGRRLRIVRFAVAIFFGLLFALPATGQWHEWMLFRNSQSFGIKDAQFGNDIGFYVFRLPFITFALDWFFAALVFITILVLLTHVLNGGVVLQPPRPKVRRATKAHIAVLLALLAVVKAGDYWVTRYELTTERRGFVQGATYSVVNAQLPAVVLLALIALLVAGLFLSTLKTDSWRLPVVASGLWVVLALLGRRHLPGGHPGAGGEPQPERPRGRLHRAQHRGHAPGVRAGRRARGRGQLRIAHRQRDHRRRQPAQGRAPAEPGHAGRPVPHRPGSAVGPDHPRPRHRSLRGRRPRAAGDGGRPRARSRHHRQQVVAGPSPHLHPRVRAGARRRSTRSKQNGRPLYEEVELDRPELYFSQDLSGYAIVGTSVNEEGCSGQTEASAYSGRRRHPAELGVQAHGVRARASSTTTCSARAPSTTIRGSCGSATSASASRRSRRSWRSTATRTRWRSTARSMWVVDALHHLRRATRTRRTPIARSSAATADSTSTSTTSATA